MDIEKQTIDVITTAAPAVVSIVMSKLMPRFQDNPFHPTGGPFGEFGSSLPEEEIENSLNLDPKAPKEKVKVGGGSGFIVGKDGLVLTNKHVVFDADAEYTIVTNEGKEYLGHVVSRDPITDVAVLKIEAKGLPVVTLGNSDHIKIGQTAIAIGNALGMFSNSVSKGIISGLGRKISAALGQEGEMEHLRNVIQTDVAINQGNSGGPLINLDGEVVGINTAIIYGAQNIGFSIPINAAKRDLDDILSSGRIIRPYLGLRYVTINKELQSKYKLAVDYGALVIKDHIPGSEAVIKGSPAHKAGIKENDIILTINDEKISEDYDIADFIENSKVGDTVQLTYIRNDKKLKAETILQERK